MENLPVRSLLRIGGAVEPRAYFAPASSLGRCFSPSGMAANENHSTADVTALLAQIQSGEADAYENLLSAVYDELRRIARGQLRGERTDHTLRTTELVHEAYMKLVDHESVDWQNRRHFFAVAARAMRQVLVDYARHRTREKRGGNVPVISLDTASPSEIPANSPEELLVVDDALNRLAEKDERMARVVECRFFGDFTLDETAEVLGVSRSTVVRDWRTARAWLNRELSGEGEPEDDAA